MISSLRPQNRIAIIITAARIRKGRPLNGSDAWVVTMEGSPGSPESVELKNNAT